MSLVEREKALRGGEVISSILGIVSLALSMILACIAVKKKDAFQLAFSLGLMTVVAIMCKM